MLMLMLYFEFLILYAFEWNAFSLFFIIKILLFSAWNIIFCIGGKRFFCADNNEFNISNNNQIIGIVVCSNFGVK